MTSEETARVVEQGLSEDLFGPGPGEPGHREGLGVFTYGSPELHEPCIDGCDQLFGRHLHRCLFWCCFPVRAAGGEDQCGNCE